MIKKIAFVIFVTYNLLFHVNPAISKEYSSQNGAWEVWSSEDQSRCVAERTLNGDPTIMLGIYPNDDEVTLAVTDARFSGLLESDRYEAELYFYDDEIRDDPQNIGEFIIIASDGRKGTIAGLYSLDSLYVYSYNFGATHFAISLGGVNDVEFSISGMLPALEMAMDCLDGLNQPK